MDTPPQNDSQKAGIAPEHLSGVPEKAPRIHIGFIDALRALAALYVMFGHAFAQLVPYKEAMAGINPRYEKILTFIDVALFRHGHLAVAVFIVISGYCLMLPLARHDKVALDGTGGFIKRRAWRILPPYYAALAFTLALMLAVPGMSNVTKGEGASALPVFQTWTIVSHVLLFHHWSDLWIIKIVPPFWSIGVEWQIYFFMPLLLLPLLRRLGKLGMLLVSALLCIVLTYACASFLPEKQNFIHFIALFAAGMVTAQVCFSPSAESRRLRERLPATQCFVALLAFILMLLLLQTRASWSAKPLIAMIGRVTWANVWVMDYLVTLCFCSLLVGLCQETKSGTIGRIHRLLHWSPLVFVGHFSYSLYLIHDPILRFICTVGEYLHFNAIMQYVVTFMVGVPCAIASGYLLFLSVERHFIRTLPSHAK